MKAEFLRYNRQCVSTKAGSLTQNRGKHFRCINTLLLRHLWWHLMLCKSVDWHHHHNQAVASKRFVRSLNSLGSNFISATNKHFTYFTQNGAAFSLVFHKYYLWISVLHLKTKKETNPQNSRHRLLINKSTEGICALLNIKIFSSLEINYQLVDQNQKRK